MAEQGRYFVNIQNPAEFRKSILETSRSVIFSLQRFERFKERRAEKQREMERLKSAVSEISDINSRLRKILPQPSSAFRGKVARPQPKLKVVVKEVAEPKIEAPREQPKARPRIPSELEKLNDELRDIESKLTQLS